MVPVHPQECLAWIGRSTSTLTRPSLLGWDLASFPGSPLTWRKIKVRLVEISSKYFHGSCRCPTVDHAKKKNGVSYEHHYIDDFITAGKGGTDECSRNFTIMHKSCKTTGTPVEPEKSIGPITVKELSWIQRKWKFVYRQINWWDWFQSLMSGEARKRIAKESCCPS